MNYKLIIAIMLTFVSLSASAQKDSVLQHNISVLDNYAQSHPIEKVHLHIDRQLYFPGDTIWFEAYTVIGPDHKLSALSNILYAELIDPKDSVVKRLTLGLQAGTAPGDFELPYNATPGSYRIRAYTNWMRNFGPEYFFDQRITVSGFNTSPAVTNANNTAAKVDIQFFPEGGDLVNGLRSKVAFKAINQNGLAEEVQGSVVDNAGNEVATFSSQHLGMGAFPLEPQAGKQYVANLTTADGNKFTIYLPQAKSTGYTLTINNSPGDSLYLKVAARNITDTAFYLLAQHDGKYDYAASGKVTGKPFIAAIPKSRFQTGIEQFTLFSQNGEPLNERVVFIQNDGQLHLTLTTDKQTYAPDDEVKVNIEAKDKDGKPAMGTFSVAVIDESKVPVDELNESNIFTDLLLKSEISGYVEQPNYYFIDPNDKTKAELDLLMLTQGYRRFEWKKMVSRSGTALAYKPEQGFSISGRVTTPGGKAIPKGEVILTSPRNGLVMDTLTDEQGRFVFNNIMLRDTATIIINSKKANGGSNVKTVINKPQYPAVQNYTAFTGNVSTVTDAQRPLSVDQLQSAYKTWKQDSLKHTILLKEVTIKGKREDPFHPDYSKLLKYSANLNGPGNANQVIIADDSFLIYSSLAAALSGKVHGAMIIGGGAVSYRTANRHLTGRTKPMALYVDGVPVPNGELDNISPAEVYSVEVLTSAMYYAIYGSSATGGALIITLKNGSELLESIEPAPGLVRVNYKGVYKSKEFYSPRYAAARPVTLADNRRTVYWQPTVTTDDKGKASFSYFNPGDNADCRLIMQGIGGDGAIGALVLKYKVALNN